MEGGSVAVEAVVVADRQGVSELGGFFLQEPDADADADPTTSEGIFVAASTPDVAVGDAVRVEGTVVESFGQTQIGTVTTVAVCDVANPIPTAATVTRSATVLQSTDLETVEGMRVHLPQTLSVNETYTLARFGEVLLAVGMLDTPTDEVSPGAVAAQMQTENDRRSILLDDGSNVQNPPTVPYLPNVTGETLRRGSTTSDVIGVMGYGFGSFRVHPTDPVSFVGASRPTEPPSVGGDLTVASFNVLNYFTTIDDGGNGARGADSAAELTRQQDKLVAAITELDADILGLVELESNGPTALGALVDALNAATVPGTYAYVADPAAGVGTDAIKVGFAYQPARVAPIADAQTDTGAVWDRQPVAQRFEDLTSGERFWTVVNHFKSKGSCPAAGDPNADQGDGQGCWNAKRVQQSQALDSFIDTDLVPIDPDVLIIGDLNAYAEEDPVAALESEGYTDLMGLLVPSTERYSYVFDGQAGYLDHALASASLVPAITGTAPWHINADEPLFLDYNTEFNPPVFYVADEFRSSDHDPVVIGMGFDARRLEVGDATVVASRRGPNVGMYFPITLNRAFDRPVEITYETNDDTATGGSDYVSRSGSIVIPAGKRQATVAVFARPDRDTDPTETFTVDVVAVDQPIDIADGSGRGIIRPAPDAALGAVVSAGDLTIAETDDTTRVGWVTLSLSEPVASDTEIFWEVPAGSAHEPEDFRTTGGTNLVIPANATFVRVPVRIVGDLDAEGEELFSVVLSPVAGVGIDDGAGTVTLRNDD
jgi:predicted extracellular nuclease